MSIQGFPLGCSKMMLSFLYWHLLHSSLSWGIKSQGNSTTWKNNLCKWDDRRGEVFLWLSRILSWGTFRGFPTIEMMYCILSYQVCYYLLLGVGKNAGGTLWVDLNSGCVVYSNSLMPGPEMTETTSVIGFVLIVSFTVNSPSF